MQETLYEKQIVNKKTELHLQHRGFCFFDRGKGLVMLEKYMESSIISNKQKREKIGYIGG